MLSLAADDENYSFREIIFFLGNELENVEFFVSIPKRGKAS